MQGNRQVREVVLTVPGRGGCTHALVNYHCGGWGITSDGEPMPDLYWPEGVDGLKACVTHLMRLANLPQSDPQ